MTAESLSQTGDIQYCMKPAVPDEKKIDILRDFRALNPSGIIGMCLIVTYFTHIWTDLYSIR